MYRRLALFLLLPSIAFGNETLRRVGDVLQVANPLIGLYLAHHGDTHRDFIFSYAESMAIVGAGKYAGNRWHYAGSKRPSGTSHRGMPSGHTVSAWCAAAHTRSPYLYTTAALTGSSRVLSKKHTIIQVLVSVAVCEGVAYFNKKLSKRIWIDARLDDKKYGINITAFV